MIPTPSICILSWKLEGGGATYFLLMDENVRLVEDVEEVKSIVKRYFEKCFEEPIQEHPTRGAIDFKQISSGDSALLLMPFLEEEIKGEVWNCDGDKSPRPDEFNLRFIKECWHLLKDDIVVFFNEFYLNASLPKAFSASFIMLIPKNDHPQSLGGVHAQLLNRVYLQNTC